MAFPSALAGRALSAYNLVIFIGVFVVQWGIGLLVDAFRALGWPKCLRSAPPWPSSWPERALLRWFLWSRSHNRPHRP
jgi:hypothetical protein